MERSTRMAVAFWFLLLGVHLPAVAQDPKIPAEAKRKFKHSAQIVSMYDNVKNQTTVVMDWYFVYRGVLDKEKTYSQSELTADYNHNWANIQAAFVFPGKSLTSPPEAIEFGIKVGNEGGPKFKTGEAPELTAIVDGETISLGKVKVIKSTTQVTMESEGQVSYAQLAARFTHQGLQRITQSRKVVMKVGELQFELREQNLEALRDLASRVVL